MKNKFWLMLMVVGLSLCNIVTVQADSSGYTFGNETQRNSSATIVDDQDNDMMVVGNKVYYAWSQWDGTYWQIWTANSNLDGTGFTATQLTSGSIHSRYVQLFVEGSKIYYVYGRLTPRWMIFTATSNLDGSNFVATQQTAGGVINFYEYRLWVYGTKVYYVFIGDNPFGRIYTASTNLDGSGWSAALRVASGGYWEGPQLTTDGTKLYYVWQQSDGSKYQIWTADSNMDGTGFTATKRTTTAFNKHFPKFIINGTKLYYAWNENDGTYEQIWTAEMNLDGSGWTATKQTTTAYNKQLPQISFARSKMRYVFKQFDGTYWQVWKAEANTDGTGFVSEQLTTSNFSKQLPLFYIDDFDVVYMWDEFHAANVQVMTATGNYFENQDESTTVTATVPSSLTFNVTGITAGNACANSGGNASVTTTASTIPFGTYTGAQTKIACQTLIVSTNATDGYVVTVQQNQDLTSNSDTIAKFSGTYALPTTWSSPPGSGINSYFGFTTDDSDYSAFQIAKYAKFGANNTPYNVATGTQPVVNATNVISYQLETNALQEAGTYSNTIMYIATATF